VADGGRVARRILVVDDSGAFRRTAATLLALRGYELLATARDGRAAIEAASRDCPDGVLLDVNLPDWDGFAVARALAAVCPAVRIVLTSADVEDVPAAQLARCQAAAFVPKDELAVVDLTRWFGPDGRCRQ
jgi:two-component system nitrate/nitrite response regulator NarL